MNDVSKLISRAEGLVGRLEKVVPGEPVPTDWKASTAFRWRKRERGRSIEPVKNVHRSTEDLCGAMSRSAGRGNTRQFVEGYPANNVLLTGAPRTGKSSLVKALLNRYAPRGPADRGRETGPSRLADIVDHIYQRPERFVLYCDDLSSRPTNPVPRPKVVLDGSWLPRPRTA